jgi:hypothetical protein
LQGAGTLCQGRVRNPGEEQSGSFAVIVLVNEDFRGDGEVAGVVENVGILTNHRRWMHTHVILAEEDFVILVLRHFRQVLVRPQDVRRSPADYVCQRHFLICKNWARLIKPGASTKYANLNKLTVTIHYITSVWKERVRMLMHEQSTECRNYTNT